MKVLAMTVHDRSPEILRAVFASLRFPGNEPDAVAVCYDRSPPETIRAVRDECTILGLPLREAFLIDDVVGFRCPSKAWNGALNLVGEDHAFCISSDCVLGPHSIDMAYHLAGGFPSCIIVGRAEHSGPSYYSEFGIKEIDDFIITSRVLTSSIHFNPIGFAWLLPMKTVRETGGYDEAFMDGFCYEDNDFVIRMWRAGADIIFCDDVLALHIEHKRLHVFDREKIAVNEAIFVERYGNINYLERGNNISAERWITPQGRSPGLGVWFHERNDAALEQLMKLQATYGDKENWRAIPSGVKHEAQSDLP